MKTKIRIENMFVVLLSVTALTMTLTLIEARINPHPENAAICNYTTPGPGQLCVAPSQINLAAVFR
ncbi:hypothetical protein EMIT0P253_10281 [Pseudomonas sp. IT-P253]